MEGYASEKPEETMPEQLRQFISELSETIGEELPVEYLNGTYEIDADDFTLTFTTQDEVFEIRSIDVRDNTGLGRQIISSIHEYADENSLDVVASNVLDSARGFWKKMGYQEGEAEDEYFRTS